MQALSWRLMAFGILALSRAMGCSLIWQSLKSRVVPYVVEVDRLGEARAVSPAEADYQPTDPSIVVGGAPPLFLVDGKGKAQLVYYRLKDRFYVVDRIIDQAELRLGTRKQQVVRVERTGSTRRRRAS